MKPRLLELVDKTSTAESVYSEKYQWLMRWALHFCGGDREMAEDLVQDTFVRMLSSWTTIRDVEHPERFLYTYLKYGFLRLRNADRRQSFQSIEDDFDLLDISAPPSGPGLIEWQEEIRSVVGFLCARKATAKSASILLFRYFHGVFPAEIMLIARISRKAVDDSLASSKQEARNFVSQGVTQLRETSPSGPQKAPRLVTWPAPAAPSTEEFMRQILQVVHAASDGSCLSYSALCERYSDHPAAPVDCWLLSHIVSCSRCLDIVIELLKLPPRGSRPLDDVLGYAPKAEARGTRSRSVPESAAMRSIANARQRYRTTLDHKPRSIVLIVNGERIASRDVSSSLNKLTVDLRVNDAAELIEVVSEQALLLTVPVLHVPPEAAPVQQFKTELGGGRSIALSLEFNPIGMRLHVTYRDPLFLESLLTDMRSSMASRAVEETITNLQESRPTQSRERTHNWLQRSFTPWFKVATALATLALVATPLWNHSTTPQPATVITGAIEAVAKRPAQGIQEQRIRIVTPGASLERTLHSDLAHKLRTKQASTTPAQRKTEEKLASAHVEWNDPLSPVGFRDWQEEQPDLASTSISHTGQLLTLTTKVTTGTVREQSITLNASTLHTVGRTVRFSDDQQIEIAELAYTIIPLAKSDPAWFESELPPDSLSVRTPLPLKSSSHQASLPPTQGELDVAELSVRLAMVELRADGSERLAIDRRRNDILVQGLVATNDRKQEIEKRLRLVPHASTLVRTFAEFDASASSDAAPSTIAMSASTDTPSPLDALSAERHLTAEKVTALHASLLQAAVELRRSATELHHLDARLPPDSLTHQAADMRASLVKQYRSRLDAAALKEQQSIESLGATSQSSATTKGGSIAELAIENAQLCMELISQQNATPRPAQAILRDLATSAAALQRASGQPMPPS